MIKHVSRSATLRRVLPASLRGLTIGCLGAGTMGQAIIHALLRVGCRPSAIVAADPHPAARRRLRAAGIRVSDENLAVAASADVLILAIKPQQMAQVLRELATAVPGGRPLVVSIAAGIPVRTLETQLPKTPVVRVMPNLPLTIGCGFSAYTMGRRAAPRHRRIVRALLEACGQAVEVPERLLDAVTAVSGSGPAYVFFLTEAWEAAALAAGLPAPVARAAVRQTLAGSVKLLAEQHLTPVEWIQRVASRKGTTEAALQRLARRRVREHLIEAIHAAAARSRQLSGAHLA